MHELLKSNVISNDLPTLSSNLTQVSHEFRQQVAARLQPALNAYISDPANFDVSNLDGKKHLCEFVEKTLEPLGLAVKVPNTPGLPGKFKATTGNWPGVGRFVFEVYIDGKQKKPAVTDILPNLELIDSTPSVGVETAWQSKIGSKSARNDRKRG
jgi:hypothetical protein